ncbi:MAG: hypothetical protein M3Y85_04560 [Bacteroidota bacterium]|nr:hypothetical protein [Bacteroidota bacterium]
MTLFSRISTLCLLLFFASVCKAQNPASKPFSNLRTKRLVVKGDSILLDTLSIIPTTFSVNEADSSTYRLDFVNAVLYWKTKPSTDTISVIYRVFPNKLNSIVQRNSFDSIIKYLYIKPFEFNGGDETSSKGLFDFGNIQYNGSFGRALSFGNNQDAVVNSNFQLQLNGFLKDSIEISAALTDNNIPIQPDGTTQQLNEFDQVFLQFKKRNWQLNLGDIDIRQGGMYFLNFYKRLQGVSFQITNKLSSSVQSTTLVSGSVAKGKFTRNILDRTNTPNLEGNQGPYRLKGANNETFFIVLANTESVYLDGELLQRGEDQDYIINYNTAEVTFMPKRLITKDSRLQIEFEYADRNFLNANLYLNQEIAINNKLKFRVGVFNNSDSKNSSINQSLDAKQKQFLFNIGDSINKALYPTVLKDTFSTNKILYQKIYDTAGGVVIDSFYKYSVNPDSARYDLSFSNLGQGNGNYVPDFNGANGKVYRYIRPVGGIKQGSYEPVMVLVTPKKQQLISFGTDYQIDKNNLLKTEMALSNYDVNTFSTKDGGDDVGMAARFQYSNTVDIIKAKKTQLVSTLDYEHVQEKFRPIERLRFVEFSREWGLPLAINPATENILRLSSSLKNAIGAVSYQFMTYQRSDNYKGYQNILQHTVNAKGWAINNQFSVTTFSSQNNKGSFIRPVIDMSRLFKKMSSIRLGFRYALEKNEIRNKTTDTISPLSFSFDTYSAYLKSDEAKNNKWGLTFFTRSDKYPTPKALVRGDRSYNTNLQVELLQSQKHQLIFSTTYRLLKVYDKTVSNQKDERTILGRTEYNVLEWKGLLTGNVLYELGTGQEQRRDYAYLEVPAGQGEFTWIDANNDGIQQLNEFEIALFRDQAKFIRIFTPTNQYTKANYTTFNYRLDLNPKAMINSSNNSRFLKFIARFNLQSSLQKTKKSIAKSDFEFNPFKYSILDTSLLTNTTALLNTVSFNRFSSVWGVDLTNIRNSGKALLTYGYETRQNIDWNAKLRWNISPSITFDMNSKKGTNALYTPAFANRNYELSIYNAEPRFSFIRGTIFRIQASYKAEDKKNKPIYGGEQSFSNSINLETKYNVLQNSSINARFTYNNISFKAPASGIKNSSVEYIILDALRPGANYLWSLDFTKRLLNNVEINFQYEGRKPADTKTIHVGRAAIRALF